jgi:hypothetical protein
LKKDKEKLSRKILKSIVEFIPALFGVTDWKRILTAASKEVLNLADSSTCQVNDKGAFIKLLAQTTFK